MFFHIFRYRIKVILRDKTGLFWLLAFPVLMSLFFYLTFGTLGSDVNDKKLKKIPVAVTASEENPAVLDAMLESGLFEIIETTQDEGREMLAKAQVTAVINAKDISAIYGKNEFSESITKIFLDRMLQTQTAISDVMRQNPSVSVTDLIEVLQRETSYIEGEETNDGHNLVIYFYSLIAMAVLMGATLGVDTVHNIQANQSPLAARNCASPTGKMVSFTASVLGALVLHIIAVTISVLFIRYVLGVEIKELVLVLLLVLVGSTASVFWGTFLSALIKKNHTLTLGILIGVNLVMVFCTGMMGIHIKYMIDSNFPIINQLNPAAYIVNALYGLYYYGNSELYMTGLIALSFIAVLSILFTYLIIRRQKYANI